MKLGWFSGMVCSRRAFLASCSLLPLSAESRKRPVFPSEVKRYADPSTELIVSRLTDPAHTSRLPAYFCRFISRRRTFLIYSSDRGGSLQVFRMDLKSGENRLLTEAAELDPSSISLFPDERSIAFLDGRWLHRLWLDRDRTREIYEVPDGYEHPGSFSMSSDGKRATLVEMKGGRSRLRLVDLSNGKASTVFESDGTLRNPVLRPNASSILFQGGDDAWWIIDYNGRNSRRLETAPGRCAQALWSPDGRTVLYLNIPPVSRELNSLREFLVTDNRDQLIAKTTQFVRFAQNRNASVFVCASGSKASPYIMLLLRVGRELTLCEHRASDPSRITTAFSPDSRWIFFESDGEGKSAIYAMAVNDLVEQTESDSSSDD